MSQKAKQDTSKKGENSDSDHKEKPVALTKNEKNELKNFEENEREIMGNKTKAERAKLLKELQSQQEQELTGNAAQDRELLKKQEATAFKGISDKDREEFIDQKMNLLSAMVGEPVAAQKTLKEKKEEEEAKQP